MISHRSVLECCRIVAEKSKVGPSSVAVIWLPQYHDMGLIGGFMTSFYAKVELKCCSPLDFLARPVLWNELVMKYKVSPCMSCVERPGFTVEGSHVSTFRQRLLPVQTLLVRS